MRKEKPKPIEGKINFSSGSIDEKNLIYEMTNDIKKAMGGGNPNRTTNKDMLFEVMTFYIKNNLTQLHEDQHMAEENNIPFLDCSFTSCNEETSTQKLFVTAETSIENLIKRVINHGKVCKSQLHLNSTDIKGHVRVCKLKCEEKHELLWSSSSKKNRCQIPSVLYARMSLGSDDKPLNSFSKDCINLLINVLNISKGN
ncbi:unnamed protein product [Mytilus coruscus]|uniref:Uncharacterized protein n=1 Tax=Mytilus coruscus TaxID=42192 RepID=A0A6J8DVB4_MYTCO|nr:unnamed protein product [Mytilus coruscus]